MGAAVSSGGLRSIVAASSSTSIVQSSYVRFSALPAAGVSFSRDMHAHGRGRKLKAPRSNSAANKWMAGPEGGLGGATCTAAAAVEGGHRDASLEKSEAAVERCDAPLELITLIVGEDSTRKRHQLGNVLASVLKKERLVVSSSSKEHELVQERAQAPLSFRDKGTTQQPLHVEKKSLNDGLGDAKQKPRMRKVIFDKPCFVFDALNPPQRVLDYLDGKEDSLYANKDTKEETEEETEEGTDSEEDTDSDTEEEDTKQTTQQPLLVETGSLNYRDAEYAPVPIESYRYYNLDYVTSRYCNTVRCRNSSYNRLLEFGRKPFNPTIFQVGGPGIHRSMLEDFEQKEIPGIKSGQVSRREGWKNFLLECPTLKSGLEHHAKWGPDIEKQVEGVFELWRVAEEAQAHAWRHRIAYQVRSKLDNSVHFDIGPLSRQQVSALQCLGEYQRTLYVAVDKDGIPASFLGRDVDPCVCAYCLAAGPNRENLFTKPRRPSL